MNGATRLCGGVCPLDVEVSAYSRQFCHRGVVNKVELSAYGVLGVVLMRSIARRLELPSKLAMCGRGGL
ncbi:hypothetical protein MARPO_0106s0014 [Marchantia polymorpha]|uniref:Uncharacterized protein n=1 Tax=Marchantia polymorpha TaxID=3197 RepID=A0A2R6WD88_MARPO|nr:hypothetical protein MARPO_0106s0014 [Marchantia polymorpha]|eukprot:PTQ31813.1 hypothetical protein MARPO_0106s0014 [Marchantia polymorpha]